MTFCRHIADCRKKQLQNQYEDGVNFLKKCDDLLASWKMVFNLEKARDKPRNLECLPLLSDEEEIFLVFIRENDLDTVIIGREWAQLAILWHWQIFSEKDYHYFINFLTFFFLFSSMKYEILHIVLFVYIFIYTNATWWRTFEASMKTNRRRQEEKGGWSQSNKRLDFENMKKII